jgi:hypothetical protein
MAPKMRVGLNVSCPARDSSLAPKAIAPVLVRRVKVCLNVEDKIKSGLQFTRKKPVGVDIYPTEVRYQINYRQQNGQWIYAYSRGDLTFKLNWDKKIFNTIYNTTFEMAVTDWKIQDIKVIQYTQKLNSNVIMSDKVLSLGDPDFWGEYNIIEPEKSIESAIKKIKGKNLKDLLIE